MISGSGFMYPLMLMQMLMVTFMVSQYWTYGIKKLTYATDSAVDSTFGARGIYRGSGNCRTYYNYAMQHIMDFYMLHHI